MFCHVAPLSVDRYIPDVPVEAKMLPPSETIDKTVPILGGEERVHDVPLFVDLNIPSSYVPAKIVPPISVRQRILIVSRLPAHAIIGGFIYIVLCAGKNNIIIY